MEIRRKDVLGGGLDAGEALHGDKLAAGLATGKWPQQCQQRLEACARPHLQQQRQAVYQTYCSMRMSSDTYQLGSALIWRQRQ